MENKAHVCPPWVGKLMVSPLRKLYQNPFKILSPYIHPGYKIIEVGPGMGFFSLPMAKQTGNTGMVYCVDIQQEMLNQIEHRAKKYGLDKQITTILSTSQSFEIGHLANQIDFALLFAVVHEIPNQEMLFIELAKTIKTGGKILFAEPKGHVQQSDWEKSLDYAKQARFEISRAEKIKGSRAATLTKL